MRGTTWIEQLSTKPHMASSDDGTRIVVTNREACPVTVIDTAKRNVIDTIKVGEGPNGITFRSALR